MIARLAERRTLVAVSALIALVALYPHVFPGSYARGLGIAAGAMATATVGFVLLMGLAHQLALGQAAFCMLGGYASAILCAHHGWDPLAALVAGMALSATVAYAVGLPILRLRGFVLAMASLALQLILIFAAEGLEFTGGALGIAGVPKFAALGVPLGADLPFYYVVWLVALGAIVIGLNIDRSRIGRALRAIADSETVAAAAGIDITRYKAQMFVVSAAMASVSGSLTVHFLRVMEPHVFGFTFSLNLVTAVVAGGLMSVWGGALGASIITVLRELLRVFALPLWESVIMGALTVFVLIVFPRGFAGFVGGLYDRAVLGRGPVTPGAAPDPNYTSLPTIEHETRCEGMLLEIRAVSRSFGNLRAVAEVSFDVRAGSVCALIGPNGAGKTTLFNLVSGLQPLDAGNVLFRGREIGQALPDQVAALGIGRTFQNPELFGGMSVIENVMCGRHRLMSGGLLGISLRTPAIAREEAEARAAALDCLRFVGLAGAAEAMPDALSFGHQRLVEIARALALRPILLLMDEPASGLNDTETEALAAVILRINSRGTTILLVEHDVRLVMGVADHVVVMHHGEKIAEGPPDSVRTDARVVEAYLGR